MPLKNHGKRMFLAPFCPDYIRRGGNGRSLGECQGRRVFGERREDGQREEGTGLDKGGEQTVGLHAALLMIIILHLNGGRNV